MSENEKAPEQKIEKQRIKTKFEWSELNRAVELLQFFDSFAATFLKRTDPSVVEELRLILLSKISEVLIRKYQFTLASINLETAINIIDEELPKILKSNNIDIDEMLKAWGILKNLFSQKEKGGEKK